MSFNSQKNVFCIKSAKSNFRQALLYIEMTHAESTFTNFYYWYKSHVSKTAQISRQVTSKARETMRLPYRSKTKGQDVNSSLLQISLTGGLKRD